MRIATANEGRVAVYFPAANETSGLRFHLHAPFVPALSRASIKDTAENAPLFRQLARLAAGSLHEIRELGLLNADFLAVLPSPQDKLQDDRYKLIHEPYAYIRAAIIDAMNNNPLTPTYSGGHAAAKRLLQATPSLKQLLSDNDVEFLVDYDKEEEPPLWAISPQKNSRIDQFLGALAIRKWDLVKFIERLIDYTSHIRSETENALFYGWLSSQTPEWHQQLYALLSAHSAACGYSTLASRRIVRLSDGSYSTGSHCFFPGDGIEHDEEMPRVARAVYSSGADRQQQKAARKFLEDTGVRPVGEAQYVERILQERYSGKEEIFPHKEDLPRFAALVEKEPQNATLFLTYPIFEDKEGSWSRPGDLFLDVPFLETSLSAYHDARWNRSSKIALASRYASGDCGISVKALVKFATLLGVQSALAVVPSGCRSNPSWKELTRGDKKKQNHDDSDRIDIDFDVAEFDKLLSRQTEAASQLIWLTMTNAVTPNQLTATWKRNDRSDPRHAPSRLVHRLINAEWIPQTNGVFVRPSEASSALLPEGFRFREGCEWLKKVQFGKASRLAMEEVRANDATARGLGFRDAHTLELAKEVAALLPREELEEIIADFQARQSRELPRHEPRDPKLRAERVRQEAANAPVKTVEERTRSVSVGRDDIKKQAEPYLKEQYMIDGEMICQICQAPLPFKLDDGTWFFEKVEFLANLTKHHRQNYLALCPNHAAMFLYANGSKEALRSIFLLMKEHRLKIVLAQQDATIYFTETHAGDIRAAIDAEQVR